LAGLVKAVDAKVAENAGKGLKGFVCATGGLVDDDILTLAEKTGAKMPLTVASEKDGPAKYQLNKQAMVTVIVYNKGKTVVANFAFENTSELTKEKVEEIVKSIDKAL